MSYPYPHTYVCVTPTQERDDVGTVSVEGKRDVSDRLPSLALVLGVSTVTLDGVSSGRVRSCRSPFTPRPGEVAVPTRRQVVMGI